MLEKAFREAVLSGRIPVVAIELHGREYAVIGWDDFLTLWGRDAG